MAITPVMIMQEAKASREDQQLDIEAEILRHIWYEGKATPHLLSGALHHNAAVIDLCLKDLIDRGCVYQFWLSPQGHDFSVYCLTKRVQRRLKEALKDFSRYKLKNFWLSFNRETLIWLSNSFQN